ncbi:MAG: LysM peptidoglycan-binding domain-containing protein [Deltaproteobacteria bacterium]|nr:LysM peptidoglycan-binding domain-containing protein [Deltaproteobacteria bacterium]
MDFEIDIDDIHIAPEGEAPHSLPRSSFRRKGFSLPKLPARLTNRRLLFAMGALGFVILLFLLFSGGGAEKDLALLRSRLIQAETTLRELQADLGKTKTDLSQQVSDLTARVAHLQGRRYSPPVTGGSTGKTTGKDSYHTVGRGQTLSGIARSYGLPVEELYRLNGITSKTTIYPGQKIRIGD